MFGWFKKQSVPPPSDEKIAHQVPGEVFPWPKGWQFTALDEAIIAVPSAILGDGEAIGSVIRGDDGLRMNIPTGPQPDPGQRIMIWLKPGESVWLTKSCQGIVVPQIEGDTVARRFRVTEVAPEAKTTA